MWRSRLHCLSLTTIVTIMLIPSASQAQQKVQHHIKTVFIVLMENQNWAGIKGNPQATYINHNLLPNGSHAELYFNPPLNHPSLPNYLWLEAGTNFGIHDDNAPSVNHQSTTEHLVTLLKNANVTWKAYAENIDGLTCPLTDNYPYAAKHNPFVYFDDVTDNLNPNSAYCIEHIRPFSELSADLQNGNVASYNFIIPNLCDDMHDVCQSTQIKQGDDWLSQQVPMILASQAYHHGGALFVTWDEAQIGDGPIGMIVLSPFAKGNGYENFIYYDHGSTLRTMEEIFGVSPLLQDAAGQNDLRDLFAVFP